MKTVFDVLFVLICLSFIITGTSMMIHLRGANEHPENCGPCHRLRSLFLVQH